MSLQSLSETYGDEVVFLSVVREDGSGNPATVGYAEWYADDKGITFPTIADVGGNFIPFMLDGYPTNVIVDLRTMEYKYSRSGLMTETEIRAKLTQYAN